MSNNLLFYFFENRAVCEIIWKNIVVPGRPQMSLWRMRPACYIPKATNTSSKCVILTVFRQLQWLHESLSMLRYTCLALLIIIYVDIVLCEVGTVFLLCHLD